MGCLIEIDRIIALVPWLILGYYIDIYDRADSLHKGCIYVTRSICHNQQFFTAALGNTLKINLYLPLESK